MRAHQIMTRKLVTVSPDASISEAARLMIDYHVSGLPVVDAAGKLVGIVTERDFLRRHEVGTQRRRPRWLEFVRGPSLQAIDYVREAGRKVHEIMTREVRTVTEETGLADIVDVMEKYHIKRVPVVQGDKLVGIVSRQNFVEAIADLMHDVSDVGSSDALIRRRIVAVLRHNEWTPFGLDVRVKDGVVDIDGFITDENVRRAIVVAAENVAGVTRVNEHLCWVDPMSGVYFPPETDLPQKPV
ncbi:CBS domain-containing protein [Tardiphaga sp. 866_E4_N2_1]|jgi:CBS domain-containing protein|uniref:CBS domain-containing protein n=1 Tax=unclassified Tardiphaga TaxID=2631404 RepID=UPI003F29DA90